MPKDDKTKDQWEIEQEELESGEHRDRIQETLEKPHALMSRDKIQTILAADYMPGLIQLIASLPDAPSVDPRILMERLNTSELSTEEMAEFKAKIDLFRMFCGQSGRDLRRESDSFVQSRAEAMPGMITPELLLQQEGFQEFLHSLLAGPASMTSAVQTPLSDELRQLIDKPEALYERILSEANMVNYRAGNEADIPETWRGRWAVQLNLPEGDFEYEPLRWIAGSMYNSKNEMLANKKVRKWIDLVGLTFLDPMQHLPVLMLAAVGFIPDELYTKKLFRQKVEFEDLAKLHTRLKETIEGPYLTALTAQGDHHKRRVLHARAQLLRHLFTSGIAETVKKPGEDQVTLDANGLFINLSAGRAHKKAAHVGLHSHLPYSQVTDELLEYLIEKQWITPSDGEEIRLQRAKVNSDVTTENAIELQKAERYYTALKEGVEERQRGKFKGYSELEGYAADELRKRMTESGCPSEAYKEIAVFIRHGMQDHGELLWKVLLDNPELQVPEGALRYYMDSIDIQVPEPHPRVEIPAPVKPNTQLLYIASKLQQQIANVGQDESKRIPDLVKNLQVRSKVLHKREHYKVAKILGLLLEDGLSQTKLDSGKMLFRGRLENQGKDEVHFLESPLEGKHFELLLIPRKHLNARQRREFERVPELRRPEYEEWMRKFEEFNEERKAIYVATVEAINTNSKKRSHLSIYDPASDEAKEIIREPAERMIQYFERESSQSVEPLRNLQKRIEAENNADRLGELLREFDMKCIGMFSKRERELTNI